MNKLYDAFSWFISSTIAGSIVIVFIFLFLFVFRKRFAPRIRHILWIVVLIRLLVPVFPNSQISILQILSLDFSPTSSSLEVGEVKQDPHQQMDYIATPDLSGENYGAREDLQPITENALLPTSPDATTSLSFTFKVLAWLWGIGVLILLFNLMIQLLSKKRQLKTMELSTDAELVSILEGCKKRFSIRMPVRLYLGQHQSLGPHIFGIFNPSIYVPKSLCTNLNRIQLTHIMMHELAHLKRKDLLWNLLGSIALAIHWMNPLVWFWMKWMKGERELACDAYVLNELGEYESISYGMTIIEVLKMHSKKRTYSHILNFYGTDPHRQLTRRIEKISSFKKGSYKLTTASILCVIIISASTLTNAPSFAEGQSEPSQTVITSTSDMESPRILFETANGGRIYDNMESAIRVANFEYKLPTKLPANYKFEQVQIRRDVSQMRLNNSNNDKVEENTFYAMQINFSKVEGKYITDKIKFSATSRGNGIEQAYQTIYEKEKLYAEERKTPLLSARENDESLIEGIQFLKGYFSRGKHKSLYYFWEDEGVQYELGPFVIKNTGMKNVPEAIGFITSMKKPELPLSESYTNSTLLNAEIYDTEDIKQGIKSVGITPKLPLQVLNEFKASGATVTLKVNFGHPTDEKDKNTRLFSIRYTRKQGEDKGNNEGIQRFSFQQIKNNNIYETLKSKREVDFQQIDGKKFSVKVHPIVLAEQEVYRTNNYKLDGVLSTVDEPDIISYFWKEGDVCYQVRFTGDGAEQMNEVVSTLIRERPLVLR
jgi:bla regulator protein BlaR1